MIARIAATIRTWQRCILLGLLLGALLAAAAEAPGGRKLDSLNFVKVEVPLVLKALADISGANIVIGTGVQGTITLNLTNVTVEEALDIITKMSGLTCVYANGAYLVGAPTGATQSLSVYRDYVIVTPKSLAVADIQSALSATFPDVTVKTLPPDRLMFVGKKERLTAAVAFLDEIDTGVAPSEAFESAYRVKAIVPWQAKRVLEQRWGARGLTVAYGPGADVSPLATPPTAEWVSNTLLLRGPREVIEEALAALAVLDEEIPRKEVRTRAKRIFGTQAIAYLLQRFETRGLTIITAPMTFSEVATTTGDLKLTEAAGRVGNIGIQVKRGEDGKMNIAEPIGDFILSGPEDVVNQAIAALDTIDVGEELAVKVCNVQFIQAGDAKKQLEEMFKSEGLLVTLAPTHVGREPSASGGTTTTSTAGGEIRDLILRGPETVVARAAQLLIDLDALPPQVAINTEIISVDSSQIKNLGIQWSGVSDGTATLGAVTTTLTEQPNPDVFTLGRIVRSQFEINAVLNALISRNQAKVINRPSTVIQHGREASMHVGDQIYFEQLTGYSSTGLPIFSTTTVDSGVTLKVRPLVARDGTITLEINTQVTDPPVFRTGSSGAQLPILSKNESTTVVKVRNGETLVIGGLVQNRAEEVRTEVPVLGKIPLIGKLFTSTRTAPSQKELLIMVTPRLMNGAVPTTAAPVMD